MYDVTNILWTFKDFLQFGNRSHDTVAHILRCLNDIPIEKDGPEMKILQEILKQLPEIDFESVFNPFTETPDSWCSWDIDEPSSYEDS